MNATRRTHLEATPPVPAILGAIVSVQGGAALAKGLFPALGPIGTVGLRVVLSAIMLFVRAVTGKVPRFFGILSTGWHRTVGPRWVKGPGSSEFCRRFGIVPSALDG